MTFVTASAGNHGLSVVAGANAFGAKAVIYLAETVPVSFQEKLRSIGADVVVEGVDYEASMSAAEQAPRKMVGFYCPIPPGPDMRLVQM